MFMDVCFIASQCNPTWQKYVKPCHSWPPERAFQNVAVASPTRVPRQDQLPQPLARHVIRLERDAIGILMSS